MPITPAGVDGHRRAADLRRPVGAHQLGEALGHGLPAAPGTGARERDRVTGAPLPAVEVGERRHRILAVEHSQRPSIAP